MKLGMIGLPNVGKSTLFNSITSLKAESANYPFCTIEPNVGIVSVPDKRLNILKNIYNSKKIVPACIEFVDIAGLVKGASKGEGLGNKFLSHIREVDAIIHVVRCFEDNNIVHVDNFISPIKDIETINLELILSDIELIEKKISKVTKNLKSNKSLQKELDVLNKLKTHLNEGNLAKSINIKDKEEKALLDTFNLITYKPVLYAANISEEDLLNNNTNKFVDEIKNYIKKESSEVFTVCAKIEEEISQLDQEEKINFLSDLNIEKSSLDKIITASYKILGLISYITAGEKEIHAWTIKEGTKSPKAASKIHTDFERGFIKAEVINYEDLIKVHKYSTAKEMGLIHLEGKDYIVKDGDIITFKFNV